MSQQEQTQALAEQATAQVLAALAAYTAGVLTYEALVTLVAGYAAAANNAAATIGDLSLAATVTIQTGRPVAPLGLVRPTEEPARLERATRTILDDLASRGTQNPRTPDAELEAEVARVQMRLRRLVEAEVRQIVAQAHDAAMKENDAVIGWTRGLEPEACQLCRWWWREGRVWPPEHPFQHHTGCDCSQIIVTRTREDAA